jgi:hypothetical protein
MILAGLVKYPVQLDFPELSYYDIPISWFEDCQAVSSVEIQTLLAMAIKESEDFAIYFESICALHRRRVKYRRILATQPMPTMDQIGPRVLLEFGNCDPSLLASWMTWRKWIYDIDNRAAQETGYVFEPVIAICLGGCSMSAKNSPVKRTGKPTEGRQIDCYIESTATAYELKLRVTIAASGQGRFGEELSFPEECQAANITPVLLVLDPTPSAKLDELSRKYLTHNGEFYHGDDAWRHIQERAGSVIFIFINNYIRPAIEKIEGFESLELSTITLSWTDEEVVILGDKESYKIPRTQAQEKAKSPTIKDKFQSSLFSGTNNFIAVKKNK